MAVTVQMPKQGNTVEECLLVEWKVKEGDSVKAGDVLCAIETDKASFEVESPADGVALKLLAKAGDLVPVLAAIAVIGAAGENVDDASPASPPQDSGASAPARKAAPPAPSTPPLPEPAGAFKAASPRARNLSKRLGVDPLSVSGTGPKARVTSRDVQAAVDAGSAARVSPLAKEVMRETGMIPGAATGIGGLCRAGDLAAADPADAEAEVVPYKGIRKLIGDRMRQSLLDHAQLTLNASADASGLMALRKAYKENAEAVGLPAIGVNDLICWVIARTLPSFPELNAVIDQRAATITRHGRVNLAFAVDTPRGLMVPVVPDAHRLSPAKLSTIIASHAAECRKGSINPDLLTGGTFTVSNLGGMGVESFTPVLNSPQVAVMGVCAIRNHPEPGRDGGIAFVPRLGLSLTIDHQAVDGAPGARFLQAVVKGIENIQTTLALYGSF